MIKDIAEFNPENIGKNTVSEIKYIDTSSVIEGRLITIQKLNRQNLPSRAKRLVRKNDIIISTVRPNLKHYYFIKNTQENLVVSTGFVVIRPIKVNPLYLYYFLITPMFIEYLVGVAESHTSAYPSFPPEIIENAEINLPDENVQEKIGKILYELDNKIENLQNQNKVLEEIAQAVFKSWFVDYDKYTKFENSEIGQIPKGWKITTLSELSLFALGGTWGKEIPSGDYNSPSFCIRGMNIPEIQHGVDKKVRLLYGKSNIQKKRKLMPCDIVIEISGGSSTQLTGRSLLITSKLLDRFKFQLLPASFCKFIRLKNHKFSYFVYFLLRWIYDIGIINQYETGTTAIKNFQYTTFSQDYKFALPTLQTIDAFNQIVELLLNKIDNNIIQFQNLSKIRNELLPKLMSGEIRV